MSVVVHYDSNWTLKVLIDLADNPKDVKITTAFDGSAVVIPDELYERYLTYQSLDSSSPIEPEKMEHAS